MGTYTALLWGLALVETGPVVSLRTAETAHNKGPYRVYIENTQDIFRKVGGIGLIEVHNTRTRY